MGYLQVINVPFDGILFPIELFVYHAPIIWVYGETQIGGEKVA